MQFVKAQNQTIETTGDIILYSLPAIALGSTLVLKDYQGTGQFAKGFALNQAVTFGLKLAINKPRPDLSNNNAFPSGHTSTTFQSAAFIQRRYGWEYGIPAYVLAGFTGYSRIEADKHDILDILAGAVIGIGSTYLFTKPYEKQNMQLTLTSGDDGFLVGFNYQF
ncbi:phosphoesterase [Dokdonia pacifica]|nr:phosphoesterase [Dokdonia pacifica]